MIMFSQSRDFSAQGDRSLRPAHSLVTEAPPNVVTEVSTFGIGLEKLLILPRGNIEIAIHLAAAKQQVQQSLAIGVGGCPERARLHPGPLHAIPSCNNVARGGWPANSPSASPTTFRNQARRWLPAKSMPPNSSASSS